VLYFKNIFVAVSNNLIKWFIFGLLSLIWGSSFILMKIGLENSLTAYQIASLRIVAAGITLLPIAIKNIRGIPRNKLLLVFISGALGSLLPAYLFCIAEEEIDSSLAGTLNCLTPIFVIITGVLFFKVVPPASKVFGILIAFTGSILLLVSKGHMQESKHLLYVSLVILATFLYGFNVNMVTRHLLEISSFHIAAVALVFNAIPALIVLIFTGYFGLPLAQSNLLLATGASSLLGVFGTAVATVLFYVLVKSAGGIFASMVTYGIPFVAIGWGIYFGEQFGWKQVGCLLVMLLGVYWVNKRPLSKDKEIQYNKKTFPD
jgi:drug/metabolite transporter (DMT)-like permease